MSQVWDSPGDLGQSRHYVNGHSHIMLGRLPRAKWLLVSASVSSSPGWVAVGGCGGRENVHGEHIDDTIARVYKVFKKSNFEAKEDTRELGVMRGNFCCIM